MRRLNGGELCGTHVQVCSLVNVEFTVAFACIGFQSRLVEWFLRAVMRVLGFNDYRYLKKSFMIFMSLKMIYSLRCFLKIFLFLDSDIIKPTK